MFDIKRPHSNSVTCLEKEREHNKTCIGKMLTLFMLNNFLYCLPRAFFGSVRTCRTTIKKKFSRYSKNEEYAVHLLKQWQLFIKKKATAVACPSPFKL